MVDMFRYPTVSSLAEFLSRSADATPAAEAPATTDKRHFACESDIAIVGMAGQISRR